MVNRFFQHLLHRKTVSQIIGTIVFEERCIICGENGRKGLDLCHACEKELPWPINQCQRCALELPSNATTGETHCGKCLHQPPDFHRAIAIWNYAPPIAQLISAFKYQRKYSYGRVLAELAAQKIADYYQDKTKPDFLIATPLHWKRHLKRGFNQSSYICTYLSKCLNITTYNDVKRIKSTPAQQSLDAKQRQKNITGAFSAKATTKIRGCRLAIIDDVLTTGATANELSRCLLNAGVREVHIWSLARTPI